MAGPSTSNAETLRLLNVIAVIAIADAVLLGFLLWASFSDNHSVISTLGPIHGVGFLALLYFCIRGAAEKRWGWWFPAIVLVTLGPPGSLVGDVICRRRLADGEPQDQGANP